MELGNIRRLKTKDFFTVTTIISKMAGDAMKDITEGGNNPAQVGAAFIANALRYAETDIKNWLADLAEITPEQFDDLPFDAPIQIIEQLAEKENLQSFLQRVMGLRAKLAKSPI